MLRAPQSSRRPSVRVSMVRRAVSMGWLVVASSGLLFATVCFSYLVNFPDENYSPHMIDAHKIARASTVRVRFYGYEQVVWEIERFASRGRKAQSLRYGVVPVGFREKRLLVPVERLPVGALLHIEIRGSDICIDVERRFWGSGSLLLPKGYGLPHVESCLR